MATSSEVKSALDAVAAEISAQRAKIKTLVAEAAIASAALGGLPALYADVVTTINGYGTTDAFESLAKAELAKLSAEFTALKADFDTIASVNLAD